MYIAILGRQSPISMAELESLYGHEATRWWSDEAAIVDSEAFDFERLGGTQKAGKVITQLSGGSWKSVSTKIVQHYSDQWKSVDHKITLGISLYGFRETPRDIQRTGIALKKTLRSGGVSLRLIPNAEPALNTATSHHNKLGLSASKVELLIVRAGSGRIIIAESVGAQNITALARRDQARPRTDAFVGMLPPKLARMMVNMAETKATQTILDPFCGTGVVLQEAALLGYDVVGTDLSEKMVDYARINLQWLRETHNATTEVTISQADAMTHTWRDTSIDAVVCETYLGQPFSAPPSSAKLTEVRGNCNHIISTWLKNIAPQLAAGTPLCIAVPAWNDGHDHFTHLPFISNLSALGYQRTTLHNVRDDQLLYYREGQVVARELLILSRD